MKKIINFFNSILLITFNKKDTKVLVQAPKPKTVSSIPTIEIKHSKEITNNGKCPRWSPDGSMIAYKVHKDLKDELWIYEIKKSLSYAIIKEVKGNLTPTWSPDSRKIAFDAHESSTSQRHQIWIKDLDKDELYLFTKYNSDCTSPAWSNDGTHIAFISNNQLKIKNINTSSLKKISHTKGASNPTWNPQDSEIVFSVTGDKNTQINSINLFNSNCKLISSKSVNSNNANYSMDGKYIAYETKKEGKVNIYVYCTQSKESYLLKSILTGGNPCWSPQGNQLVLEEDRFIKILNIKILT